MPPEQKPRYPRATADQVLAELLPILTPHCLRLEVAGSYRRVRETVGDLELVFIPRLGSIKTDLFGGTTPVDLVSERLKQLLHTQVIVQRRSSNGNTMWGPKNKFATHLGTGLPLDFFATDEESWWNYLVCRTGSQENNIRISQAAQAKGWNWNPYGSGFTTPEGHVQVTTEQEAFTLVGLPYIEPHLR